MSREMQKTSVRAGAAGSRYATAAVRYGRMRWVGEFTYSRNVRFGPDEQVVVQTDRGTEIGQVLTLTCGDCRGGGADREQIRQYVDNSGPDYLRPKRGKILRIASAQDIDEARRMDLQARQEVVTCQEMAEKHGLKMRLVSAEHLFGGERIIFYFMAEARVDFRGLVKDLAVEFQTRIEMRQIGARDEARLLADYEICGRECCCKNFLKALKPVSMAMAKTQKATLDPGKISGRCGRLRCCLRYENAGYNQMLADMPKIGQVVRTAEGPGRVIDRQALTQLVLLEIEPHRRMAVSVEDLLPAGQESGPEPGPAPAGTRGPDVAEASQARSGRNKGEPAAAASEGGLDTVEPSPEAASKRKRRRRRRRRPGSSGPDRNASR